IETEWPDVTLIDVEPKSIVPAPPPLSETPFDVVPAIVTEPAPLVPIVPNPYLTFAALLHAGLEGIERGYELPEPMETNLYHLTPEQRRERGIVSLPETLGEAVDELAGSELARKALGPHIFERYVELKRKEWDEYRLQLTDRVRA